MAHFSRHWRSHQKEDLDKSILHFTEAIFLLRVKQVTSSTPSKLFITLHMLFLNAPRGSARSLMTLNMLWTASGTSEDFPSIPSTSPEQSLQHYLSGPCGVKFGLVLGIRHRISRLWWSSATNSFPPTNLKMFLRTHLYTCPRQYPISI